MHQALKHYSQDILVGNVVKSRVHREVVFNLRLDTQVARLLRRTLSEEYEEEECFKELYHVRGLPFSNHLDYRHCKLLHFRAFIPIFIVLENWMRVGREKRMETLWNGFDNPFLVAQLA